MKQRILSTILISLTGALSACRTSEPEEIRMDGREYSVVYSTNTPSIAQVTKSLEQAAILDMDNVWDVISWLFQGRPVGLRAKAILIRVKCASKDPEWRDASATIYFKQSRFVLFPNELNALSLERQTRWNSDESLPEILKTIDTDDIKEIWVSGKTRITKTASAHVDFHELGNRTPVQIYP